MDSELYRHARPALAGCLSERGYCDPQQSRWRERKGRRADVAGVAPMAQLRGAAYLEEPDAG